MEAGWGLKLPNPVMCFLQQVHSTKTLQQSHQLGTKHSNSQVYEWISLLIQNSITHAHSESCFSETDLGMGPPHMWLSHLQTFIFYKNHHFQRLTYYVMGKAGQDGQHNCGSSSISMQFSLSKNPGVLDSQLIQNPVAKCMPTAEAAST